MITITLLNRSSLRQFIASSEYHTLPFVPITPHRALSHIANPAADEEDILLLLAYEEKTLVGYLGVLAGRIQQGEDLKKCGWLSCMWIHPEQRGKQIAQKLLEACFEVWDKAILVTEFTIPAARLYEKTGAFNDLQIRKGIRLYVRSDLHKLLPPHKKIFATVKPLLRFADLLINGVADIRFLFRKKKPTHGLEYANSIDEEINSFIAGKQSAQLFKRNTDELNWIIKNPWILSAPEKDEIAKRYSFSAVDRSFVFYAVKVRNAEGRLAAFMLFSKRNNVLKLPYVYFDMNVADIVQIIMYHIISLRINTFSCFHPEISAYLQKHRTPALYKKEINRHYIISKVFTIPPSFDIQDGDADCSFT